MDEDKSAWSMLGKSAGLTGKTVDVAALEEKIKQLEAMISIMQGEMLGSIEALQRRISNIENSRDSKSVLDVMPVEELNELLGTKIGQWPEIDEEEKKETVTVVEGLTYSKPDENELTMEEEWASQNKIAEMVDEEHPTLLEDEYDSTTDGPDSVTHKDCALAIVDFISDRGGVANADWKRHSLTPEYYDAKDRKKVDTILRETLGVVKWNKNNMWHFYYMDGDDRDEALERAYGTS
jgi:hypothetical protein